MPADPPGGRGGWGLGKPDRTVWPPARRSVAGPPVPTYDDGFPKAPPTPPALSAVLKVGSRTRGARLSWAAGRDCVPPTFLRHAGLRSAVIVGIPRESFAARLRGPSDAGGRKRRVGLRKPVVVRSDRRTAYRHSGGLLDGPIGFPKAHPSLPPGERAVRVRTETLPHRGADRDPRRRPVYYGHPWRRCPFR